MNKLRSALTMLGIVIGVACVIATVAIGSGATQRIQDQIASIGSNIIIITPGSTSSSGVRLGTGNAVTLSEADAKEIPAQCPDVALAAPYVRGGAQVVNGNNNWATQIYGVTPDYLTIRQLSVADGAEFTQQDVDQANKVAVLGKTPVDNLFGGADPVGQTIRIKNVPFTVVGVLTPKGQSAQGQDQDDVILLPISSAKRKVIGANQRQCGCRGHHHDAGKIRQPNSGGAGRGRRRCSGNGIICRHPRTTTFRFAICRSCSPRRRRRRASWRSCSPPWLRCRWSWAASAS